VFLEKHWKCVVSRSVCDYFFEEQKKVTKQQQQSSSPAGGGGDHQGNHSGGMGVVGPVIATPHHYLITAFRKQLHFIAVTNQEGRFYTISTVFENKICHGNQQFLKIKCLIAVPPLFVIEFLHRVVDILEDYFGECNETVIKEHYVIVYEVTQVSLATKFYYQNE
jgi:AP-3 complex subunit mu